MVKVYRNATLPILLQDCSSVNLPEVAEMLSQCVRESGVTVTKAHVSHYAEHLLRFFFSTGSPLYNHSETNIKWLLSGIRQQTDEAFAENPHLSVLLLPQEMIQYLLTSILSRIQTKKDAALPLRIFSTKVSYNCTP